MNNNTENMFVNLQKIHSRLMSETLPKTSLISDLLRLTRFNSIDETEAQKMFEIFINMFPTKEFNTKFLNEVIIFFKQYKNIDIEPLYHIYWKIFLEEEIKTPQAFLDSLNQPQAFLDSLNQPQPAVYKYLKQLQLDINTIEETINNNQQNMDVIINKNIEKLQLDIDKIKDINYQFDHPMLNSDEHLSMPLAPYKLRHIIVDDDNDSDTIDDTVDLTK